MDRVIEHQQVVGQLLIKGRRGIVGSQPSEVSVVSEVQVLDEIAAGGPRVIVWFTAEVRETESTIEGRASRVVVE